MRHRGLAHVFRADDIPDAPTIAAGAFGVLLALAPLEGRGLSDELVYNAVRPHSVLGDIPPEEFEQCILERAGREGRMTAENRQASLAETFNRSHAARLRSATLERIYRAAYGDDYPEHANPNAFFSRTTLERLAAALRVGPGNTVVDLGCGHGGPGLWVARQTGTHLIGIDISSVGVALARERAAAMGLTEQARFQVGDLTATGLPNASCDAAMSLDVLVFVPNKSAAVHEVARVLRTRGAFVFTTWEQAGYSARLAAPQIADHRPLLEAAGFVVENYEEPPDSQRQQRGLVEGIIAAERELGEELGAAAAAGYVAMARGVLADLPLRRYVSVVARRH